MANKKLHKIYANFYINNHKIDKKWHDQSDFDFFFNQQTLMWMLVNIIYNNICVIYQK